MNTVVYFVSWCFPMSLSLCGNQDINCLYCFVFLFLFLCSPIWRKSCGEGKKLCIFEISNISPKNQLLIKPLREPHCICTITETGQPSYSVCRAVYSAQIFMCQSSCTALVNILNESRIKTGCRVVFWGFFLFRWFPTRTESPNLTVVFL